jgi:hypothetical protein
MKGSNRTRAGDVEVDNSTDREGVPMHSEKCHCAGERNTRLETGHTKLPAVVAGGSRSRRMTLVI